MSHQVGMVEDLATLSQLDNNILLTELKTRYLQEKIYTYIGDILVAVNPFRDIGICDTRTSSRYHLRNRNELPPHIFAVADTTYQAMIGSQGLPPRNQCILISGESGAGKTESTKFLIKQLVEICKGNTQLEQQILQVNPLLEAFGNAQTLMNDNSSRFGKYIQLKFYNGKVIGAKISEYLLEKSRVVQQAEGEENFHIFYYVLAGLSDVERQSFGLAEPHSYKYLCDQRAHIKKRHVPLPNEFDGLVNAMDLVGFTDLEQADMFTILSAVLSIGNIAIGGDENGQAKISNKSGITELISKLIDVDRSELEDCLTCSIVQTKGEQIIRNYTVSQALDAKNAVAKAIYGRLFGWIVYKINTLLAPQEVTDPLKTQEIGILDIFGFEKLATNSFEQACINLTNEQLQFYFNQHIFSLEQEEYKREGVNWKDIKYIDNKPLLDLFLAKPIGLLALLDEESQFPKGSDQSFVEKLTLKFDHDPSYVKSPQAKSGTFTIVHYAGKVTYSVQGWLEKNRDTIPAGVLDILQRAGNQLLSLIFKGKISRTGTLALHTKSSHKSSQKRAQIAAKMTKERKLTVSAQFKNSLSLLMEKMTKSQPVFVRCVKPNREKVPKKFDDKYVMDQLLYTGMLETIKIRREGFAVRPLIAEFVDKYKLCVAQPHLNPSADNARKILKAAKLECWKIGVTKVFLKYYHVDQLAALMDRMGKQVVHMQKAVRGFLARQRFRYLRQEAARQADEIQMLMAAVENWSEITVNSMKKVQEIDISQPAGRGNGSSVHFDETMLKTRIPPPRVSVCSGSYLQPSPNNNPPEPREYTGLNHVNFLEVESDSSTSDSEEELTAVKAGGAALYGPVGTRQASVRWFQATQATIVQKPTAGGGFAEWFHGIITRHDAEQLLASKPVGCFLIRVSESRFGYSLSFRVSNRCRHYMIDQLPSGKFIITGESKVHKSLHAMVEYHQKNKLSNWDGLLSEACGQVEGQCDYSELLIPGNHRIYADLPEQEKHKSDTAGPYHPYLKGKYFQAIEVECTRPPKLPAKLIGQESVSPPPVPDRNYSLERPNHASKPMPAPPEVYNRLLQNQQAQSQLAPKKRMSAARSPLNPPTLPPRHGNAN